MDSRRSRQITNLLVLSAIAAICVVALAGIISTRATLDRLDHQSATTECARQIAAEQQAQSWRDVGELIGAYRARDAARTQAASDRLLHTPNYADLVTQTCN